MPIVLPVALVFGIITLILVKGFKMKLWHALVAALFGFFLASSGLGPAVTQMVNAAFAALGLSS